MAYETKETWFIDETTITGSNDQLRNDIGTAWTYLEQGAGHEQAALSGVLQYVPLSDLYTNIGIRGQSAFIETIASKSRCLAFVGANLNHFRVYQSASILPNYVFPCRLYGAAVEDMGGQIRNTEEWKAYLLGGTFGKKNYPGVFSEETFDIFGFQYRLPYTVPESQQVDMSGVQSASIHYLYKQHLSELDKYTQSNTDVRTLPNIELLKLETNRSPATELVYNYFTLDNTIDTATILSASHVNYIPPIQSEIDPTSGMYIDLTKNLRDYIIEFSRRADATSEQAIELSTRTKNLFYDKDAQFNLKEGASSYHDILDTSNILDQYPYYVQITWDPGFSYMFSNEYRIRTAIENTGFDSNLLYLLKKQFGTNGTPAETKSFVVKSQLKRAGKEVEEVSGITTRAHDFIELLLKAYTPNYKDENCYFVQGLAPTEVIEQQKAALASPLDGSRFVNTYSSLNLLTYIASICNYEYDPTDSGVKTHMSDYGAMGHTTSFQRLSHAPSTWGTFSGEESPMFYNYLAEAQLSQYNETLAYRIEKKSGNTPIQDIWIYNSHHGSSGGIPFTYNDSQVAYDSEYTYTVYAYVLVGGFKYRMGDLRIGRNIGTGSSDTTNSITQYCVQFEDPSTNKTVDQLYFSSLQVTGTPALSEYATDAQILSIEQYVADCNFYYEPSFKIIEIPIMTKDVTVLDHPAGDLDVTPFQKIDNSQTLGFLIRAESFEPSTTFPQTITEADKKYKSIYLTSNDLAESATLRGRSVTQQSAIEIFRMDTKPSALTDFAPHLYKTISLKIGDTQQYLSEYVFYDKVRTNKKYYYIMRFLNEKGSPGTLSPIIQAELIDDGGYKYSLFENIFEEDLVEESSTNPSIPFKKLMHILPNPAQLFFNTENIDFSQTAESQLSNLKVGSKSTSVFDNTFKVRLTSKKTGKKIDLNLTFNLNEET